jgi:riboflavin kinase/FMN adenylyltransferase
MLEGHDFTFGAKRSGTVQVLGELLQGTGAKLEVIPSEVFEGTTVSSSRIRQALTEGHVGLANQMLGRNFYVEGIVENGDARGRILGFPTANLKAKLEFIPRTGVYAGYAIVRGKRHKAVQNIGVNPTFLNKVGTPLKLEVHLLDFTGDLYGEMLRFEFVEFIRSEKKFSGVEELKSQIQKDIQLSREKL